MFVATKTSPAAQIGTGNMHISNAHTMIMEKMRFIIMGSPPHKVDNRSNDTRFSGSLPKEYALLTRKCFVFFLEVIISQVSLKGNNIKNYLQYKNCVI